MTEVKHSFRVDLAEAARAARGIAAVGSIRMLPAMRQALDRAMLELVFQAQKERFSGKGPFPPSQKRLGVRSGRLRRDLHAEPVKATESGFSGRIGSNVKYFRAHELGFSGTVSVRAHVRGGYTVKKRGYSVLEQSVRAHSRKVVVPRREPLMTAIREHSERIISREISAVFAAAMKGGLA